MKKTPPKRPAKEREVIGWREIVSLPEFGVEQLQAKIDTGARTSALHATDIEVFDNAGARWVRFNTHRRRKSSAPHQIVVPVHDERNIKNTSGIPEQRVIVRTTILLGRHRWHVDVSLANRENMEFDLIIGRTSLHGHRVLVDPGRSYLVSGEKARIPVAILHSAPKAGL